MTAGLPGLLRKEFLAVVAEAVGPPDHPDLGAFEVDPVGVTSLGVEVRYRGAPRGPRADRHHGYSVDRALVVEAAARTVARRGARLTVGEAPRVDDGWIGRLRARRPGLFECEVSCGPGWSDLLHVMAAWLAEGLPPAGLAFKQVKEKYGGLRAYHVGADARAEGVVDAFEVPGGGRVRDLRCAWRPAADPWEPLPRGVRAAFRWRPGRSRRRGWSGVGTDRRPARTPMPRADRSTRPPAGRLVAPKGRPAIGWPPNGGRRGRPGTVEPPSPNDARHATPARRCGRRPGRLPGLQLHPLDELSPLNQALTSIIVACATMWALLRGTAD